MTRRAAIALAETEGGPAIEVVPEADLAAERHEKLRRMLGAILQRLRIPPRRDLFRAAALSGLLANPETSSMTPGAVAVLADHYAEAMEHVGSEELPGGAE